MYRKNVASQVLCFQGVDSTNGGIKSGVTWTVRRCIDGTFAAGGGTVTEDGTTGWYKYAMSQADTNGNDISFNFTGTGAVPQTVNILTTAADPSDTVRLGLTALPNAAAEAAGGLYTRGSGAGQINQNANGQVDSRWVAGNVTVGTNSDKTGYGLSSAAVQAIWDALTSALTTASSIGKLLVDNVNASISAIKTQTDKLNFTGTDVKATLDGETVVLTNAQGFKKNTALNNFTFAMYDSSGDPATGLTVTAQRSIDGAAVGSCANSVSEISDGLYKINLANTDLNGDVVTFIFAATGAKTLILTVKTVQV